MEDSLEKHLMNRQPLLVIVPSVSGLWEEISDYLWHSTDAVINPNEGYFRIGKNPVITVLSAGHALYVFVNGQLSGIAYESLDFPKLTFSESVKLQLQLSDYTRLRVFHLVKIAD